MTTEALVTPSATGKDVTTSLKIATVFGKRHDDVLKAIRNMECSPEFRLRNFAETPCINPQNKQTYSVYEITRDGFSFLAMGFKGKKAATFKEQFIAEFNNREEIIKSQTPVIPKSQSELILMIAQQNVLTEQRLTAIEEKVNEVAAKQIGSSTDYFSVAGYSSLRKQPIDIATASGLSKRCHTLCKQLGYERHTIPDPRFGKVYIYPKSVLETVFNQYYPIAKAAA